MAKQKNRPLKRDREFEEFLSMAAGPLTTSIEHLIKTRLAWYRLTGGSAEKEFELLGGPTGLAEEMSLENIHRMKPVLLRMRAIDHWRELSKCLVGWAIEAGENFNKIVDKYEVDLPDHVEPKNRDRSELRSKIASARTLTPDSYKIVVLPTELADRVEEALLKLDYGEVDPIFSPSHRKSYKDGLTIPSLREDLLACYYYLLGAGTMQSEARGKVAEAALVSPEAVRNWERASKKEHGGTEIHFFEAFIRGAFDACRSKSDTQQTKFCRSVSPTTFQQFWDREELSRSNEEHPNIRFTYDLGKISAQYRAAVAEQIDAIHPKLTRTRQL